MTSIEQRAGSARTGGWAGRLARLLASLIALALLVYLVDLRAVFRTLLSSDPLPLAGALIVAVADRALMIAKWVPLLSVQVPDIPLVRAIRVYLASGAASLLLPGSVGGDVVRAMALGYGRGAILEVGASIAAERLLGLLASAVMAAFALGFALHASVDVRLLLPWALGGIVLGAVALASLASTRAARGLECWLGRRKRSSGAGVLRRLIAAHDAYRQHGNMVFAAAALSVIEQLFPVLVLWCIARAIGTTVDLQMLVVAVPLALFVGRLPVTFAGIGVMEGAIVYLLGLFGVPAAESLALALGGRAIELAVLLPGAFFFGDLTMHTEGTPSASSSTVLASSLPVTASSLGEPQ